MPKRKKKINLGPCRKRMARQNRLQAAKHWIPTYKGLNIVTGYRNWFGVDLPCAIQELKSLGVKLDEQYISRALQSRAQAILTKRKKMEAKYENELADYNSDSDENYYFIAGYTSWGFPYGVTWEEAAELE